MYFPKSVLAAFLLLLAPLGAAAQITSGDLAGTVKDATGASIPNAAVVVTNEATNVSTKISTNGSGEYHASNLLAGKYDVVVTASGFQVTKLRGIAVDLNKTSTSNIALSIATSTSVEVTAEAGAVLDTTTSNLTTTFQPAEMNILPSATVGLGVLNLSLLSPGVASSGGIGTGVGPSVGGQRPDNNNFTIEGIDNNNKGVTGPLVYIPNDAVGEFSLITNQFSPEFGHSSGGQFNTNVLSGTNKFHGVAYEYFQNRNLNAINLPAGQNLPNPRFDDNRYGGQLGGPILHDKLFFFVNYERHTTGQSLQYQICTPTAAGLATIASLPGLNSTNVQQYLQYTPASPNQVNATNDSACFNQPSGGQFLSIYPNGTPAGITPYPGGNNEGTVYGSGTPTQIPLGNYVVNAPYFTNYDALTTSGDWNISPKDNLRLRYIYNTEGTEDTAAYLPVFFQTLPFRYHLIAISEYHTFTPHLTNEVRVGYNRYFNNTPSGNYTYPGLDSFPNLTFYDLNGINYGPDSNAPQSTVQNLYQFTDNISYAKGNHNFKIGFDGRKYISPQTFTQRVRGDYEWDYLTEYLHDLAPTAFGQRSTGNFIYYGDQTALYGYANDTWRVRPNLTLNYGVRYEFTSVPVGERTQNLNLAASVPGLINFSSPQPQKTNFAPRVGINYAPDDKTSIRAAFGVAYDVLFDNLGLLSFPPQYSSTTTVGTNFGQPGDPNFLANGGLPAGTGTLATFPTLAAQRAATSAYLPNQFVPYAETWSLGIQHVFGSNYTAEVRYVGTRGIHLPTQDQINITPKVTAQNQLFTSTTIPLDPGQNYATIPTAGNANNLQAIENGSNILPQYAAAGFTGAITSYQPYSSSNYNGLQTSLVRRMHDGLMLNIAYTFSKTMDDATASTFSTVLTPRRPQDSQNVAGDYSRSALDRSHRLTIAAVYDLPYFKHSNWALKNLAGNWIISPTYVYESPEYATALSGVNSNLNGDSATIDRPLINANGAKGVGTGVAPVYSSTLAANCGAGVSQCDANLVGYTALTPNAYYIQAGAGTLPNAARNSLSIRPIDDLDASVSKRINITDRYAFEFQAQAFNALNHPQYIPGSLNNVNTNETDALSTQFQSVSNPAFNHPELLFKSNARTLQLAVKLSF
ncbi:TonB-dependent receptor [Granulicella sp. WH15]|nr:TonB-dependent receptor [Granulicella sp. WH15]